MNTMIASAAFFAALLVANPNALPLDREPGINRNARHGLVGKHSRVDARAQDRLCPRNEETRASKECGPIQARS